MRLSLSVRRKRSSLVGSSADGGVAGHRTTRQRGQALAEFALVVPVLLLMFAAAADFGRAFYAYVAIQNAVKEGALYGAQRPICDDDSAAGCANPGNVTWRVRNETDLKNSNGTDLAPVVACIDRTTAAAKALINCAEGDTYQVGLTYQFRLLTPIASNILGSALNLNAEAKAVVLNLSFDPTPGISVQKLIQASTARNGADIVAKCLEPDDTDSQGFYRSPCRDTTDNNNPLYPSYRVGDPITYKITVQNTGAQTLSGVTIDDSLGWPGTTAGCPARPTSMAVNAAPYVCTYTRTAPAPAGGAPEGDLINVATADATNADAAVDDVTARVELAPPNLVVFKYVSPYRDGSDGDGSINGVASFGTTQSLTVHRATAPVDVWFKVIVQNNGQQTATGVVVTDSRGPLPFGQSSASADCPAAPATIAAGAANAYECRYRTTLSADGTFPNTVAATATNATTDAESDNAAGVTVQACDAANRIVPSLIGLTKAQAQTAWTAAGFTGAITNWSGQNAALTIAQNRQAYDCLAPTTTVTISRTTTP
jgi:uncharacterized repeat protein (TIGR01451 family)